MFIIHFKRALKELDIKLIKALSPQPKGCVERGFAKDQDKLVKLMRLHNIATIEEANKFIQTVSLEKHSTKYTRKAAKEGDMHRSAEGYNLDDIFTIRVGRSVNNDWTVQWNNRWFQLLAEGPKVRPNEKVLVCRRLDKSVYITSKGVSLPFKAIEKKRVKVKHPIVRKVSLKQCKPAKDHPWRTTNSLLYK